jgi:hypothetical protein
MNRTKNTVSFSILFVFVFIYVGKNSNLRGTRRYFIALKIAWIIMFGWLDPANAKDNQIIPRAHGFKPPISRRNPNFNNPASMGEVVHLYNFENLRNRIETPLLMQAVLNGAEQAGYMDGIIFLNYE